MNQGNQVLILGTSQDGGFPQVGCQEKCCFKAWGNPELQRKISSLAILSEMDCWLIDITPDFSHQFKMIESVIEDFPKISGIFITHAHVGHYIGLLDLGLEVMNAKSIPIHVMPLMGNFLKENAPFTQLIKLDNIHLKSINEGEKIILNAGLSITPFIVPHRNEFSETVGYKIESMDKSFLYISDIDSWNVWEMDVNELIKNNDIALLDGTFYDAKELNNRNMEAVPHPFIRESLEKFSLLEEVDRRKVYFTHFNHTNPVIHNSTLERLEIINMSCNVAEDGMVFTL